MSVLELKEKTDKSDLWTIKDILEHNLEKVGDRKGTKAVIIYLDDTEHKYVTTISSAGFHRTSEIVCLLEVLKMQTVAEDMDCI